MRTCRLDSLEKGEVGLIAFNERSIAFNISSDAEPGQFLIVSNESMSGSREDAFSMLLTAADANNWPFAAVFDDIEISPDIASLCTDFQVPERGLVIAFDGGVRIAVKANGWSNSLLDPTSSSLVDFSPQRASWYFKKWALTVPDPIQKGARQPIFTVEL